MIAKRRPSILLEIYNICLSQAVFNNRWKVAKLVLINKWKGHGTRHPHTGRYGGIETRGTDVLSVLLDKREGMTAYTCSLLYMYDKLLAQEMPLGAILKLTYTTGL